MIVILNVIKEDSQYVWLNAQVNGAATELVLVKQGGQLLPSPTIINALNLQMQGKGGIA